MWNLWPPRIYEKAFHIVDCRSTTWNGGLRETDQCRALAADPRGGGTTPYRSEPPGQSHIP